MAVVMSGMSSFSLELGLEMMDFQFNSKIAVASANSCGGLMTCNFAVVESSNG